MSPTAVPAQDSTGCFYRAQPGRGPEGFFRMSRSSVTRASSHFSRRFSTSWSTPSFGDGSPNSFTHFERGYLLPSKRWGTSRTGYPRTVI
jgi:hypothetical protein